MFRQLIKDNTGATAAEYGLLVALIVIIGFAASYVFTDSLAGISNTVGGKTPE